MPRYHFNSKLLADSSCKLSIFYLKKNRLLYSYCNTVMSWTSSLTDKKSTVRVNIDMEERPHMRLRYTVTDSEGDSTDYDDQVFLANTPCHFGGLRWWFACPSCGRRVGILYLPSGGRLFRCRHCYDLTYQSRNDNRRGTWGQIGYYLNRASHLEEQENNLKRCFYKGRPTKKYRRVLSQIARLNAYSGSIKAFFSGFGI